MSSKGTILLTGGTGKVASRIAPLLSFNGNDVLVASRSSTAPSLPNCTAVKFDWDDAKTYAAPFENASVSAVFLVCSPSLDCFPPMKQFIDLAIQNGVKRFVFLSASVADLADGPSMAKVSIYIAQRGVEYAILKPTWFMRKFSGGLGFLGGFSSSYEIENFSEAQHMHSIREGKIFTATGQGKVPFVSADDIALVAFRALVDEIPHNTDYLILGPDLLSYDEVWPPYFFSYLLSKQRDVSLLISCQFRWQIS